VGAGAWAWLYFGQQRRSLGRGVERPRVRRGAAQAYGLAGSLAWACGGQAAGSVGCAHPWDGPRREEGVRQGWRKSGQLLCGWAGGERWAGWPGYQLGQRKREKGGGVGPLEGGKEREDEWASWERRWAAAQE
jgi:hypothetical protein